MLTFITIVHVLLCVFMIFVILLQPGKDAGMGAALGGGAATSAFGGRGAVTFLTKVTAVCAVLFFLTSLGLSFVGMKQSVVTDEPVNAGALNPAKPNPANAATNKALDKEPANPSNDAANVEQGKGAPAPAPTTQTATPRPAQTTPPQPGK